MFVALCWKHWPISNAAKKCRKPHAFTKAFQQDHPTEMQEERGFERCQCLGLFSNASAVLGPESNDVWEKYQEFCLILHSISTWEGFSRGLRGAFGWGFLQVCEFQKIPTTKSKSQPDLVNRMGDFFNYHSTIENKILNCVGLKMIGAHK